MDAEFNSLADLARSLRAGAVSAIEVTAHCLARIDERNPALNAYITVCADSARADAREADREMAAGRYRGPLHGVPVSLKDIIDLRSTPTTAASRVRHGHVAVRDATVTARLREAGAIFIGKTNLHEFAFGTTNEDSAFGPVHHPLAPDRSPGGSSGGSAASVLADLAYASIGTDTGGSIRIPSAACGLVGLKAGLHEIPTDGVVPLSATLDHVGPICRSVEDATLVYAALRGTPNPEPTTSVPLRGLRLGIPRPYFFDLLDSEIAACFETACERLVEAGVILEDVAIPHAGDTAAVYAHLVLPEAAAYHAATLEDRPHDYTPNVRAALEAGRYILAEDYLRARRGRAVLTAEVDAVLAGRDGLLLPTLAVPATRLGATTVRLGDAEEPLRPVTLRLTQLFNITGHPAVTLPCGRTADRLPAGAQLVGSRGRTLDLLRAAAAVEPVVRPEA